MSETQGGGTPAGHWSRVYATKRATDVSWYQAEPVVSLELIERAARAPASVLDVGGGASSLVDRLIERGYIPGVLDISEAALDIVRARLGADSEVVEWFVSDVTTFEPQHGWDVWHDRAVFHFLVGEAERAAYRTAVGRATVPGASVIIATFGPDGPDRCSGLPTLRYSPEQLTAELGGNYSLSAVEWEEHRTPGGATQQFVYCLFQRLR